ncbi:MAG: hypothetical protein WCC13_05310 [Methylovirgula sp.]
MGLIAEEFSANRYFAQPRLFGFGRHLGSVGITNGKVFRGIGDPNEVVILQDVPDLVKGRGWLTSQDMLEALQEGGDRRAKHRFAA